MKLPFLRRSILRCAYLALIAIGLSCSSKDGKVHMSRNFQPGDQPDGSILLATGQRVAPEGRVMRLNGSIVRIAVNPNGKAVAASFSGTNGDSIALIDLSNLHVLNAAAIPSSAYGLAFNSKGDLLYAACGAAGVIQEYAFVADSLSYRASFAPADGKPFFPIDIAAAPDDKIIAADFQGDRIAVFSPAGSFLYDLPTADANNPPQGRFPYRLAVSRNRHILHYSGAVENSRIFAACVGGGIIAAGLLTKNIITRIPYGGAIAVSPGSDTLIIADELADSIIVVNSESGMPAGALSLRHSGYALRGAQAVRLIAPDGIADGGKFFAALAGENAVAVIDALRGIQGVLPAPFEITDIAALQDASGTNVIAGGQDGTICIMPPQAINELQANTRKTDDYNRLNDVIEGVRFGNSFRAPKAVPLVLGELSLIENVILICIGGDVLELLSSTPAGKDNFQKIAREFTVLDSFYPLDDDPVNGIYRTATSRIPQLYKGIADAMRQSKNPQTRDFLAAARETFIGGSLATERFIWDTYFDTVPGIKTRDAHSLLFGEIRNWFARNFPESANEMVRDFVPSMGADPHRTASEFITAISQSNPDNSAPLRIVSFGINKKFNSEVGSDKLEKATQSTKLFGALNSATAIDSALGLIVESITHSALWERTAVFIFPVDAGTRRVDVHRPRPLSAVIVSPFVKRGYHDDTTYTPLSIMKTVELMLAIRPLSRNDAAAEPVRACFKDHADMTPYLVR